MGKLKTCLIVDDNRTNRFVAGEMVESLGFQHISVSSAYEALPYLTEGKVDVVLLDWHMPEVDGKELLQLIRESRLGKKLKIIIYSAVEDASRTAELIANGANGFLPKPVSIKKIQEKFTELGLL